MDLAAHLGDRRSRPRHPDGVRHFRASTRPSHDADERVEIARVIELERDSWTHRRRDVQHIFYWRALFSTRLELQSHPHRDGVPTSNVDGGGDVGGDH